MADFVKAANKAKEAYYAIDVGKLWGLYLAFKEQQKKLAAAEKIIWIINNEPRLGDVIDSLASKYNRGEFDHIIALKR